MPTVGVVVGVLHAGGGGGQEVPVMGLVITLVLDPPDPEAELGCCLPDGSFATLPAGDCTAQGGSLALLGPLGDSDGDGIDDSCAYGYGTLTFLTITQTLTGDELEAFVDYEWFLAERAVCGDPLPLSPCTDACGEEPPGGVENPFHDEWCYCMDRCCRDGVKARLMECLLDLGLPLGADMLACLEACILFGGIWCLAICVGSAGYGLWAAMVCKKVVDEYKASCDYALKRCLGQIAAAEAEEVEGIPVDP